MALQKFLVSRGRLTGLMRPDDGVFGVRTIRALQKVLLEEGYFQGLNDPIDGDFGPKTVTALVEYAKSQIHANQGVFFYYFAYGSNHEAQMKERLGPIISPTYGAYLENHQLIFAGKSDKWNGGGVATMRPREDRNVYGTLYQLTPDQLTRLDRYEGGYTRKEVDVVVGSYRVTAQTYFKNNWKSGNAPSMAYLEAVRRNIAQHWPAEVNFTALTHEFVEFVEF